MITTPYVEIADSESSSSTNPQTPHNDKPQSHLILEPTLPDQKPLHWSIRLLVLLSTLGVTGLVILYYWFAAGPPAETLGKQFHLAEPGCEDLGDTASASSVVANAILTFFAGNLSFARLARWALYDRRIYPLSIVYILLATGASVPAFFMSKDVIAEHVSRKLSLAIAGAMALTKAQTLEYGMVQLPHRLHEMSADAREKRAIDPVKREYLKIINEWLGNPCTEEEIDRLAQGALHALSKHPKIAVIGALLISTTLLGYLYPYYLAMEKRAYSWTGNKIGSHFLTSVILLPNIPLGLLTATEVVKGFFSGKNILKIRSPFGAFNPRNKNFSLSERAIFIPACTAAIGVILLSGLPSLQAAISEVYPMITRLTLSQLLIAIFIGMPGACAINAYAIHKELQAFLQWNLPHRVEEWIHRCYKPTPEKQGLLLENGFNQEPQINTTDLERYLKEDMALIVKTRDLPRLSDDTKKSAKLFKPEEISNFFICRTKRPPSSGRKKKEKVRSPKHKSVSGSANNLEEIASPLLSPR